MLFSVMRATPPRVVAVRERTVALGEHIALRSNSCHLLGGQVGLLSLLRQRHRARVARERHLCCIRRARRRRPIHHPVEQHRVRGGRRRQVVTRLVRLGDQLLEDGERRRGGVRVRPLRRVLERG